MDPGKSTEEEEVYTMLPSMSFNVRCRGSCTWVFPHSLHPFCLISLQMLVLNLGDVKMYPKEDGELKGNYLFGANSLFFFFFLNVLLLCYSFCTEERRNDTSELFKSVMKRDTTQ